MRGATEAKIRQKEAEEFQSTHPLRGATQYICLQGFSRSTFQSTHPLRGATKTYQHCALLLSISIHAPLAGCDTATVVTPRPVIISIHAPLAGCDRRWQPELRAERNFNPRTPCGVRRNGCGRTPSCTNFNPRTPCGVRLELVAQEGGTDISIHAPLAGCDPGAPEGKGPGSISIHAPLAGCDASPTPSPLPSRNFNPRTPCGVRRSRGGCGARWETYFNPRTPCGVRPLSTVMLAKIFGFQSTHPLRGATSRCRTRARRSRHFNPRTPCGVRRLSDAQLGRLYKFQSTHPLRGATFEPLRVVLRVEISIHAPLAGCDGAGRCGMVEIYHFNPRTPCGVRHVDIMIVGGIVEFQSTHPLRGATDVDQDDPVADEFQSTHPLRGATGEPSVLLGDLVISIHAPLAGCDASSGPRSWSPTHFNPRTPCGVRPDEAQKPSSFIVFQSTHPLRGATRSREGAARGQQISIHAPLAGCDSQAQHAPADAEKFQSTHPLRGATGQAGPTPAECEISIHAPLAGCDRPRATGASRSRYFNPRTPCGVRRRGRGDQQGQKEISIHAPLAGCDPRSCGSVPPRSAFQSTHPLRGATLTGGRHGQ